LNTINKLYDCRTAAYHWYGFGLGVIPIIPGTKRPAVKWTWLDRLCPEKIEDHWRLHPDHEVGCIVGDGLIVFDADSPTAVAALADLEKAFDVSPSLTVTTTKGQHHYFRLSPGAYAKSDAHGTEEHPERIDVKTGRALVILPPSTGKTVGIDEAEEDDDLTVASQEFIDAVFLHNGRDAPRPPVIRKHPPRVLPVDMDQTTANLNTMLQHVNPDCGYEDWLHTLMAIHHETGGSDAGLAIADAWSGKGAKYGGESEVRAKWRSFDGYNEKPVTIWTIRNALVANGFDWIEVCAAAEPDFEPCPYEIIDPDSDTTVGLKKYSLTGKSAELEAEALEQVSVLESIALLGQWTVIYAKHNTGKTLIVISLLGDSIRKNSIKASDVYYFNMDDTQQGLTEKLKIAEELGFHVLCDGYEGFRVADFTTLIEEARTNNQARGMVLILDTLKKFTDLMDKSSGSRWNKVIRRFITKGGTVIGLAHVNKKPGPDGKPVYAGTTDIIDDADCAYVLDEVSVDDKTKVVQFENKKRRGNVTDKAAYRYSTGKDLTYRELLESVCLVEDSELAVVKQAEEIKSDAEIIKAVTACINDGVNQKMKLRDAVCGRIGCSKRAALQVIDKYTGTDPADHRWTFTVGERGAKCYRLLDQGGELPGSQKFTRI